MNGVDQRHITASSSSLRVGVVALTRTHALARLIYRLMKEAAILSKKKRREKKASVFSVLLLNDPKQQMN